MFVRSGGQFGVAQDDDLGDRLCGQFIDVVEDLRVVHAYGAERVGAGQFRHGVHGLVVETPGGFLLPIQLREGLFIFFQLSVADGHDVIVDDAGEVGDAAASAFAVDVDVLSEAGIKQHVVEKIIVRVRAAAGGAAGNPLPAAQRFHHGEKSAVGGVVLSKRLGVLRVVLAKPLERLVEPVGAQHHAVDHDAGDELVHILVEGRFSCVSVVGLDDFLDALNVPGRVADGGPLVEQLRAVV